MVRFRSVKLNKERSRLYHKCCLTQFVDPPFRVAYREPLLDHANRLAINSVNRLAMKTLSRVCMCMSANPRSAHTGQASGKQKEDITPVLHYPPPAVLHPLYH